MAVKTRWPLPASAALLLATSAGLVLLNQEMERSGAGLLRFEFAGTADAAHRMVAGWAASGRGAARWAQVVDYGFLVAYGALVALFASRARARAARDGRSTAVRVGALAIGCAITAAALDGLQNAMLLLELGGHGGALAAPIAFGCGVATSSLVLAACAYVGFVRLRA